MKPEYRTLACLAVLSAFCSTACATYSTYTCPDPIGDIVRQECDDYKVRYESLQASLIVSVGSVAIGGSMGHEQLRDPSELIQMMMHQTLALCHDYNACRVRNEEFSRRREGMDRTFTAVMAILDQLKGRNLSDSERKVLLGELVAILKPSSKVQTGANLQQDTVHVDKNKPKSKWKSNPFRTVTDYWLNSKHLAPGGPTTGGLPKIVFVVVDSEQKVATKGFSAYLWGKLSEDDDIKALGAGGFSQLCKLRVGQDQAMSHVACKPDRGKKMPPVDSLSLSYTSGATGQTQILGPVARILKQSGSEVWLAFQPEPLKRDPVVKERPWLVMVTVARGNHQFTARCRKDGVPVKLGKSSVLKGIVDFNPFTLLQRDTLALPYTLPTEPAGKDGYEPEDDDMDIKEAQGNWKCKLKLDGVQVREVSFRIGPDGLPDLHERQKKHEVVSPWWLLETRVVPNPFEENYGKS